MAMVGRPAGPARRAARIMSAMRDGLSNNFSISMEASVLSPSRDDDDLVIQLDAVLALRILARLATESLRGGAAR